MNHEFKHKYPVEKRIEVVTKTLALGNMRLVSELTGVSYQLIRQWKLQPWWSELVDEIRASRNSALDTKLSRLVDKSLETVADRLDHGNLVMDKRGELIRKPLSALEANKIAVDMLTQETNVQKRQMAETQGMQAASMADMIAQLAKEFAKFNTNRTVSVINQDVSDAVYDEREEGLQEAVREVRWTPGSDQGEIGEELGESFSGEEDGEYSVEHGRGSQDPSLEGGEEYSVQPARS